MDETTTRARVRAVELVSPDHLPACGKCGDLNEPGAFLCQGCFTRLTPQTYAQLGITAAT